MIIRPNYLEKLKPFIDVKLVKILAGIRRCGKSTILEMLKQELLSRGVDEKHIITRKYTNEDYGKTFTSKKMYEELKSFMVDDNKYYFLLDELQEMKDEVISMNIDKQIEFDKIKEMTAEAVALVKEIRG